MFVPELAHLLQFIETQRVLQVSFRLDSYVESKVLQLLVRQLGVDPRNHRVALSVVDHDWCLFLGP